jgi:hypothetical protein
VQTIAGVVCISQEGCQNLQSTAMDCITKLMLDDERAHRAGAFMSRLVSEIVNEQV